MIIQWRSMMDNLSDIYYLVRLIIRQVSIYLRDLILYKFFWIATNNENFDNSDSKLRSITLRNVTTDIVAFSVICIILFLLVILASKCEKDEVRNVFESAGIETITVEHPEDQFCVSNVTSSSTNCVHACGDSIFSRGRIQNRNYSDEDISRVRSSSKKRSAIPKKSIFGLNVAQPQNSQSTQTTDKIFYKNNQKWLIRRTRSGHIYGKYPI
ncbi:uncharacterized protein LOC108000622 isoform X2 [Apis cerana]|uniref:Uncharacterized protein LOC107966062 n=2 Tax=Apis TaxID=7459 RepID=A0A7M7MUJ4_APIME|nr:uncharacterized protein LOC107966062 [Apis mellifera]XP_061940442.1 uncharacterized protein LOC108000622 isoform X2 [Apis cerana]XP_061940443.1 uncharacterized protein LOC108000622 isoform X2 [Apis cerana]KAG6794666.1 hypothetical protein HZU73_10231 [Apis mellifera caucasica]KAG9429531.1 hypothetical protein HZU67_08861 [Apis mellifera carnica]|eukprot:XP_026300828.1 uncharacterized protein LOC107966062 [Apis mellifera]